MLREIVYRGVESAPRVEDALGGVIRRLERQVSRFDPVSAFLRVVLEGHSGKPRFNVSARLTLRGGLLQAREERRDPVAAIKRAFGDLTQQLKRHISQHRREHLRNRVERPALVLADQLARQAAREVSVLQPLDTKQLDRLQRYVRREVFYRQLDGRFPYGIAPESVVDDTVVLALEEADERPSHMTYEAWLMRLARRSLENRANGIESRGLPQSARIEWDACASGLLDPPSAEDWLTYFQPDDEPSVADITMDRSASSPEDNLAGHELQAKVHQILGQLPDSWRHSFTLYTIEGFDMDAVASSLELTPENVKHQVSLATEFLRAKLQEDGYAGRGRSAGAPAAVRRK
ncbi:MAG: HPF/RaiA family ribosome-associated protein [Acidobacteriota bacterium]